MKKITILSILCFTLFVSCQKENIAISNDVYETFFVTNKGVSMPIHVSGNTASKVILVFVPGGPGGAGLVYKTEAMEKIEENYAVAYTNQRECGTSQGKSTEPNNMALMTEDLDLTIMTLKKRYGTDVSIFILGHSFGGMMVSSYVTTANFQSKIKGWIDADGISDYPALGALTRDMYVQYGNQEIALGNRVAEWKPILDWCNEHPGQLTLEEINFINQQQDGEQLMSKYIINNTFPSQFSYFLDLQKKFNLPILAYGMNILSTGGENSPLSKDITTKAYHSKMKSVTIPALFLVGKYDFICPPALHKAAFDSTACANKKLVILEKSGHQSYINEPEVFAAEVMDFMTKYR
jgi:pimeloyl-ACP methyl ester carboxylesterase